MIKKLWNFLFKKRLKQRVSYDGYHNRYVYHTYDGKIVCPICYRPMRVEVQAKKIILIENCWSRGSECFLFCGLCHKDVQHLEKLRW